MDHALYHAVVLGSRAVRGIAQDMRFGGEVAAGMPPQLPPGGAFPILTLLSSCSHLPHHPHPFLFVITITMPPRLQPQRLPQPSACQCLRSRPQAVAEPHVFSRSFHKSPAALERNKEAGKAPVRRKTLLRRDMDAWLAGPGFRFRRSSPGSTNYLSAYDKEGNMRRWPEREEATQRARETEDAREAEVVKQEEAEGVDEAERASRAAVRAEARAKRIAEARIPPKERLSDLYPFPLNQAFKSEAVLSEELREELYRQVVVRKMDLQGVSAAYGVDMRRVAAVIRLKTIEKQWIEEVSSTLSFSLTLPQLSL